MPAFLDSLKWDGSGLVTAIVQVELSPPAVLRPPHAAPHCCRKTCLCRTHDWACRHAQPPLPAPLPAQTRRPDGGAAGSQAVLQRSILENIYSSAKV